MTVLKALLEFVNVPEFKKNGAATFVNPVNALPVPVTPAGKNTVTSNVRLAALLGFVGLLIEKSGVPPLQTIGALLTGVLAKGVGSTITLTVLIAPFAHPFNFGVIV